MEMGFRWDFAYEILPQMLWATLNTIIAAGVGYAIALVVGLFFLLGQRTPSKFVNVINRELVEFIRSTPLCTTSIWHKIIGMAMWNDYYWFAFWNLSIRSLSRCIRRSF